MHIVIDATPVGIQTPDRGGVYRYVWELLRGLSALESQDRFTLFFDSFARRHQPVRAAALRDLQLGQAFRSAPARWPAKLNRLMRLPAECHTGAFDVYHGTFDALPRTVSGRRVVSIHDVRYLDETLDDFGLDQIDAADKTPQWRADLDNRRKLLEQLRASSTQTVATADAVITMSAFCKGEIARRLGVDPAKIHVVHHGVRPTFHPRPDAETSAMLNRHGIPRPYLLYVSKFDPLKNVDRLLQAFRQVRSRRRISLVLAGPPNWYRDLVRERATALGLEDSVLFPGFISDAELPCLYAGAEAFVLPSLYEGFCLPVIEAMASGTPVITSDTTALPEIADGAALAVDPRNTDALADAIDRLLSDGDLAEHCRTAGLHRAAQFRWETCASRTLEIYHRVADPARKP